MRNSRLAHDDFRHYPVVGETDDALTFLVVESGTRIEIPARRASYAPSTQAPAFEIYARISVSRAPEGGLDVQVSHVGYADGTNSGYLGVVVHATVHAPRTDASVNRTSMK